MQSSCPSEMQSSNFAFEADAVKQRTVSCGVRAPRVSTRRWATIMSNLPKQLVLVIALTFLIGATNASDFHPSSLNQSGTIVLTGWRTTPKLTVSMSLDNDTKCPWEGDCLLLTVRLGDAKRTEIKKKILSSYGSFQLFLVDLIGEGTEQVVLITGGGRGTSVRAELLTVYKVTDSGLKVILDAPYSEYFGSGKRWWYEPIFERPKDPRLSAQMTLVLHHDEWDKSEALVSPESIPSAKIIRYRWNTKKSLLEPNP